MARLFQRVVISRLQDQLVDAIDQRQRAWGRGHKITYQRPVEFMVVGQVDLVHVHQLYRKIDPTRRRVGLIRGQDVLLPQDRNVVFHHEAGAIRSVLDNGPPEDHAFIGFQYDFKRHAADPAIFAPVCPTGDFGGFGRGASPSAIFTQPDGSGNNTNTRTGAAPTEPPETPGSAMWYPGTDGSGASACWRLPRSCRQRSVRRRRLRGC